MHGMGYHLVAARGSTTANGLWAVVCGRLNIARQGVSQNNGCVAACLHGAWHMSWNYVMFSGLEGCAPGSRAVPACYY
jgi:hypothetical protein